MLTQFRVLQAALRLGEFTIGDLARESGVAPGSVQKMLRRRPDLFSSIEGPRTGRPGGRPKLHRVREKSVLAALKVEAEAIPVPDLPDSLGLKLVESTLLRVLPRADVQERQDLIEAAEKQLALSDGTPQHKLHADLRELHRHLRTLVETQGWLLRCSEYLQKVPGYQRVIASIEALLSLEERSARTTDNGRLTRTAAALIGIPTDAALIATTAFSVAPSPAPPSQAWWTELPAAVWSVLRDALWTDVVGDLAGPELLSFLTQPKLLGNVDLPVLGNLPQQLQGGEFFTFHGTALVRCVPNIDLAKLPYSSPQQLHFHSDASIGYDTYVGVNMDLPKLPYGLPGRGQGRRGFFFNTEARSKPALAADSVVRVRLNAQCLPLVASPPRKDSYFIIPIDEVKERPVGRIECFDFSFSHRQVMGAILAFGDRHQKSTWIPYGALKCEEGVFVYNGLLPSGHFDSNLTLSSHVASAEKEGICLCPEMGVIQIRLDPGHAIEVLDDYGSIGAIERMVSQDNKIGDVWWLDFNASKGRLITAHVQLQGSALLIPISFDDLHYDPSRNCFVLRVPPGIRTGSAPPNLLPVRQSRESDWGYSSH